MWNQQIGTASSGTFKECHSGLTTGGDPIDNAAGTYAVSGSPGNPGEITYSYGSGGSGGSYTYRVYPIVATSSYRLCRVSDGKTYTLNISSCPPPSLNNCP